MVLKKMPKDINQQGTQIAPIPQIETPTPQQECKAKGGIWDSQTQTCLFTPKEKPAPAPLTKVTSNPDNLPVITDAQGNEKLQTKEVLRSKKEDIARIQSGQPTIAEEETQRQQLLQGQQLAGQVGQFNQLSVSPTGLDFGEAATSGIVDSIPRALSLAATGAGVGLAGGATVAGPIGAGAGAAIGAVAGFVGGISSGMIGSFKEQRRDTTTAQQRVLDEGKQTMKDWATMAASDPANRAKYLAEYNKVSAQIDQAYRQMKLDTSEDVAKFETALPNLAEFEAFYAAGGERDTLNVEMKNSLLMPSDINYNMLELVNRKQ